ncbi:HEAT repeat domain-containing protein [Tautonia sp. JC769]|uniref:HEAT repeat domain-containing protein n=1 Tax=Tautonia sp. JC769 TaxID=3232135 RepID=UPI00345A895A
MISFRCASCNRSYTVKDEHGGKTTRCKQCGATMRIPRANWEEDEGGEIGLAPVSAFDDLPGPSSSSSSAAQDEPMPPPRRPGKVQASGSSSKPGGKEPFTTPEQVRRIGIGFLMLGAGVIILPMFGLQFRRMKNLSPGDQVPFGIGFAVLGGLLLAISLMMGRSKGRRSPSEGSGFALLGKVVAFGCLGVLGLIGLVIVLAIILPAIASQRGGNRVAQVPQPPSAPAPGVPGPGPGFEVPQPVVPEGLPPGLFDPPADMPAPPSFPPPPGASFRGGAPAAPSPNAGPPGQGPRRSGGTIDELLTDLTSGEASTIRRATSRLRTPSEWPAERRGDIASALASLATTSADQAIRDAAARSLVAWVGPEQLPALRQMLVDEHFVVRWEALKALGNLGTAEAAEATLAALDSDAANVARALEAIGPPAEPAAIRMLGHSEWDVRVEACRMLGAIGSRASVAPLQQAMRDSNNLVQLQARQALDAIRQRP